MSPVQKSKSIYIDETERKPNVYASRVLYGITAVVAVVWMLNELGVFTLDKSLVWFCLLVSMAELIAMQGIVQKENWIVRPGVKYVFMGIILSLVFTLTVLLNIHATLAFVLPLLLATQYRSYKMSWIAIIGSCLVCLVAPILSFFLNTWDLNFMVGYIQTFCHVTVNVNPVNIMDTMDAISQIVLYWALPQVLTIVAFSVILLSVTKSGIESVKNQMSVNDLSNDLSEQLQSILNMREQILFSLSDIIENRDIDTGGHVRRTSEIVQLLMRAILKDPDSGITEQYCLNVIRSAPMHDLGKIAIPDLILQKPASLTDKEYEIVKLHPQKSAEIIVQALTGIEDEALLEVATNIALYHHERVDGSGYPKQLKGTEIPFEARVMALADVYDALVSKRCYKEPMEFDDAFNTVEELMGTQFDPTLNKYFIECRADIEKYYGG